MPSCVLGRDIHAEIRRGGLKEMKYVDRAGQPCDLPGLLANLRRRTSCKLIFDQSQCLHIGVQRSFGLP